MASPVSECDGGVEIVVWVVPGSRRTEIAGRYGDALRIRVSQPPEKGKANRAVATLLGEVLGGPVVLASGAASRKKRFRLMGGDVSTVRRTLCL